MIGFRVVGFVNVFLDRAITQDGVLVEFRRVLGVTRVKEVFIFGRCVVFGLLFEVDGVIMLIFGGLLFVGMDFFEELFKRIIHVIFYSSPSY